MRLLAVGAHPDDVELGCGASLRRLVREGHHVAVLVLTRGEVGGDAEVRPREAIEAARMLGIEEVRVATLPDSRIDPGRDTIGVIEEEIATHRPDVIVTHSPKDVHQDHRHAAFATLSAGRSVRSILSYESPSIGLGFQPALFADVSRDFMDKMKSLGAFRSQVGKRYFAPEAVEGLARFRGNQVGTTYAEAFEVHRITV